MVNGRINQLEEEAAILWKACSKRKNTKLTLHLLYAKFDGTVHLNLIKRKQLLYTCRISILIMEHDEIELEDGEVIVKI